MIEYFELQQSDAAFDLAFDFAFDFAFDVVFDSVFESNSHVALPIVRGRKWIRKVRV
jgi:hypothetical protein